MIFFILVVWIERNILMKVLDYVLLSFCDFVINWFDFVGLKRLLV